MQYILTQEEYNNLVPKSKYEKKCDEVKKLQQMLLKASKFKCIYDAPDDSDDYFDDMYCDDCPLKDFDCGRRKDFSQ